MKKLLPWIALAIFALPVAADEIFRIQIGNRDHEDSRDELRRRVWMLERAVAQLQEKVFSLQTQVNEQPKTSFTTCYIETPFNGTFTSTQPTQTAARADALKQCSTATGSGGSVYCTDYKVKCGQ